MTERTTKHDTFVIERVFPQSRERVFNAFANPDAKARWFSGPPDQWTQELRAFDFRVGGRERLVGAWAGGKVSSFDSVYQDIVANERIIYSYVMQIDGVPISVSLATVEFKPEGKGTRLVITEQGAFLDAFVDGGGREHGTRGLLERLAQSLETEPAGA
jgi:uncharacterized protein YndB with AHSA1/START domain